MKNEGDEGIIFLHRMKAMKASSSSSPSSMKAMKPSSPSSPSSMKAMKPSSPSFNEAFMKATLFFIGPGGGASGALSGSQNHKSSVGFIRFYARAEWHVFWSENPMLLNDSGGHFAILCKINSIFHWFYKVLRQGQIG